MNKIEQWKAARIAANENYRLAKEKAYVEFCAELRAAWAACKADDDAEKPEDGAATDD